MIHRITLIAGDGIGPEVTEAVVTILERAGLHVEWDPQDAGLLALEKHGDTLPTALLDSMRRTVCLLTSVLCLLVCRAARRDTRGDK